jgi:hypothetical protein
MTYTCVGATFFSCISIIDKSTLVVVEASAVIERIRPLRRKGIEFEGMFGVFISYGL